ncbi:tyrosine phosphatase family-domain-containing protein [Tribonema minus]|uniref:diphosphoinositol-polyphosphate diphosphatase n=1 Tax=Tribonema minus TaxID=303371 RepID=A0A835YPN6_9STRA|nr:tyrosine phosphatase family-domain-containing protein [Tribonema minus]
MSNFLGPAGGDEGGAADDTPEPATSGFPPGKPESEGLGLEGLASPSLPKQGMLIPPLNWAMVSPGVYRSGYPIACNFNFLKGLRLRTVLCLCPESCRRGSLEWAKSSGAALHLVSVSDNKEPFVWMDEQAVAQALDLIADPKSRPILVHCLTGKSRTGCVVGCLRRLQGWSLAAIFDEYLRFSAGSGSLLDMQFIELWDGQVNEKIITA